MGNAPHGFRYEQTGDDVVIYHHGRRATTLRGNAAAKFLASAGAGDEQLLMARATGNYKHGNERRSKRR
ncbi:hypothetical protein [Flexivirga meconopsidis]|uniref:hypothetical protein n=1 Tax=Flexivirga meconopsidis TaxID=2977121 RepID=UPI00223EF2D8|nr:hypothetical protein [Flexivirga meconopsidis]